MKLSEARVLVVDDEAVLRQIYAKWLRKVGYGEVWEAGDGEEALAIVAAHPIDVLITDVRMPVMDGVTLVRRLAALGRRISCIVFVSAFGDVDAREMYRLGVEAFLSKPFRLEELATALDAALADRETLWTSRLEIAPRQEAVFDVAWAQPPEANPAAELQDDWMEERSPRPFRLGRGGFSADTEEPVRVGRVAFCCRFVADPDTGLGAGSGSGFGTGPRDMPPPELTGEGYVRWRSREDQRVGIEFAFLDSPGREWVAEHLHRARPKSFIP